MLLAFPLTLAASAACDDPSFRTVDRPLDPAHPDAGTFPYKIRVEPGTGPDTVPVVFLPGGPGFSVLEQGRAYTVVPAAYTVVTTELRGVGCNALPGAPSEASGFTATHADDVLVALREAGIETFVVYGHSYGSVLGTVVAHRAAEMGMTVRAVILEGTVGATWTEADPFFGGFAARWDAVRADPSAAKLVKRVGHLGFPAEVWGEWIYGTLAVGTADGGVDPLIALGAGPKGPLRAALSDTAAALAAGAELAPGERWATDVTLCRELIEESFVHARVDEAGRLAPYDDDCGDLRVDRPYDPAAFPLHAPVVYLHGEADPVTPWDRAKRMHFDAQPQTPRTAVLVKGAGHYTARQLGDCVDPVFAAAVAGRAPDATSCTRPISVFVAPGLER